MKACPPLQLHSLTISKGVCECRRRRRRRTSLHHKRRRSQRPKRRSPSPLPRKRSLHLSRSPNPRPKQIPRNPARCALIILMHQIVTTNHGFIVNVLENTITNTSSRTNGTMPIEAHYLNSDVICFVDQLHSFRLAYCSVLCC